MFKKEDLLELIPYEESPGSWGGKNLYNKFVSEYGKSPFIVCKDEKYESSIISLISPTGIKREFFKSHFKLHKSVNEIVHIDNSYVNNTIDDEIKPGDWVEVKDGLFLVWIKKFGKQFEVIQVTNQKLGIIVFTKKGTKSWFEKSQLKKIPNPNTISSKTIDSMETNFKIGDLVYHTSQSYISSDKRSKYIIDYFTNNKQAVYVSYVGGHKDNKATSHKYVFDIINLMPIETTFFEIGDIVQTINKKDDYIIKKIVKRETSDYAVLQNLRTDCQESIYLYNLKIIKKHNENVQTNEKVSGSSSIEGNGQRKTGRAITSSSRSSIATGSRLVGNEKRAFSQHSRVGQGQICFSPKHAYGN